MLRLFVRLIVGFFVFAGTVVMPMYFLLPGIKEAYQQLLAVSLFCIWAGFLFVLLDYIVVYCFEKPLKQINFELKGIVSGNSKNRIEYNHYNRPIQELVNNINSLAIEFENLEEMRRSFIASASHELRSPLASIQGFLQALLDGVIEEEKEKQRFLKLVYDESKRLTTLINGMLDLSRMEAGRYPLYKTKFDINSLVRDIVLKMQPMFLKSDITISMEFAKESVKVFADSGKIEQVISNLLDNAIKYSPAFSKIVVSTYLQGKRLYVVVKDQGYGIGKKEQMLIWDKFYRVDKARTPSKSNGTGLGLSIVKKIMDDHREVVWVESEKGKGAKFFFTLPIFDAQKHSVFGDTAKNVMGAPQQPQYTQTTTRRRIVHDHQAQNTRWGM
ncbi:MAG: cell wall metabolism sensor histidine kinase WalK [Firmicutes bacterium]|nr:cell wall metabolism sensor histidine kinase WalK [Bacillota bacterium]